MFPYLIQLRFEVSVWDLFALVGESISRTDRSNIGSHGPHYIQLPREVPVPLLFGERFTSNGLAGWMKPAVEYFEVLFLRVRAPIQSHTTFRMDVDDLGERLEEFIFHSKSNLDVHSGSQWMHRIDITSRATDVGQTPDHLGGVEGFAYSRSYG